MYKDTYHLSCIVNVITAEQGIIRNILASYWYQIFCTICIIQIE